jgi:hypothetical protein
MDIARQRLSALLKEAKNSQLVTTGLANEATTAEFRAILLRARPSSKIEDVYYGITNEIFKPHNTRDIAHMYRSHINDANKGQQQQSATVIDESWQILWLRGDCIAQAFSVAHLVKITTTKEEVTITALDNESDEQTTDQQTMVDTAELLRRAKEKQALKLKKQEERARLPIATDDSVVAHRLQHAQDTIADLTPEQRALQVATQREFDDHDFEKTYQSITKN